VAVARGRLRLRDGLGSRFGFGSRLGLRDRLGLRRRIGPAEVADLLLQPRKPAVELLAAAAERLQQCLELALELVEPGEHPAGGLLHARDVLARLTARLRAQL